VKEYANEAFIIRVIDNANRSRAIIKITLAPRLRGRIRPIRAMLSPQRGRGKGELISRFSRNPNVAIGRGSYRWIAY